MRPLIAIVGPRRDLQVLDANGRRLHAAATRGLLWADWGAAGLRPSAHSWPTWSPDGERLAVFRQDAGSGATHVYVTDVAGVDAAELLTLDRRLPIHLEWSPAGDQLAVLCQHGTKLVLELLDAPTPGSRVPVASGSPLFYAWVGGRHLAVFIGRRESASELRVVGPRTQSTLPGVPGNFCTPVAAAGEVLYVAHRDSTVELLSAPVDGGSARSIEPVSGLMALVPAPDGRRVARAVALHDGAPYLGLTVLDPSTGERTALAEVPLLAFFWSPRGDAVIGAHQVDDGPRVTWIRLGLDGTSTPLFEHLPTRDLAFWLRFFEQYCVSHPLVDATGTYLLVAGFEDDDDDDRTTSPTIWRVPLDGSPASALCPGVLAVCGPA